MGQSGTGTLNIKQKGHVDGGYLRLGSSTGGVGTVNVEGEDSVLTTELFEMGSYGTGSLNITDIGLRHEFNRRHFSRLSGGQ